MAATKTKSETICCAGVNCTAQGQHSLAAGSTVGAIEEEIGFTPFFCNDGGLQWICPSCWTKLKPAFAILDSVLGRRAAYEPIEFLVRRWRERSEKRR